MNQLLLIVSIAGSRVALPAAAVESVVELEALIPVPRAPAHIAGLSALRSRGDRVMLRISMDKVFSWDFGQTREHYRRAGG